MDETKDGPGKEKSGATVVALDGERKKKNKKAGVGKAVLFANFRAVLDAVPIGWPALPHRFETIQDERGQRTFVEVEPSGVVKHISREALTNALIRYSIVDLMPFSESASLALVEADAIKIVVQWAATRPAIDLKTVAIVKQKSETGLCWRRLDFDFKPGETPLFDEMLARTSNSKALLSWIGSLFDERSSRQQYVWLYGHGLNGKGSLLEFLKKVFGPSYKAEFAPTKGDRFWTYGLLGARIVAFPDCTDPNFVQDGLFKSITGGDAVKTEEKGGKSTTSELFCKVIFGSNDKPRISRGRADTRRIIFCEMLPLATGTVEDGRYGEKLWAEGPAFLAKAVASYRAGNGAPIAVDVDALAVLVAEAEERWEEVFERFFEARAEGVTVPGHLLSVLREQVKLSDREVGTFKKFLETRHGVKFSQRREGGKVLWRYRGMVLRAEVLSSLEKQLERSVRGEGF